MIIITIFSAMCYRSLYAFGVPLQRLLSTELTTLRYSACTRQQQKGAGSDQTRLMQAASSNPRAGSPSRVAGAMRHRHEKRSQDLLPFGRTRPHWRSLHRITGALELFVSNGDLDSHNDVPALEHCNAPLTEQTKPEVLIVASSRLGGVAAV